MNKRPFLSMPRRPLATAMAAAMLFTSIAPAPAAFAQAPSKRSKAAEQQVTLNFVNAEIEGVARAIGAMLKQQFVVDPRVKGQITLYSEEPLTTREAYLNFLAALRGQGFSAGTGRCSMVAMRHFSSVAPSLMGQASLKWHSLYGSPARTIK